MPYGDGAIFNFASKVGPQQNTDGTMGSCTANIVGFDKNKPDSNGKCTGYLLTNAHCIEHDKSVTDVPKSTFSNGGIIMDISDLKLEKIQKDKSPDLALISFKAKCDKDIPVVKVCNDPINACNYFLRGGNDYGGSYPATGRLCSSCKCLGIYYGGGSVKVDTTCAGGASGGGIYAKPKGKEICLAFVTNQIDVKKGETIAVSNEAILGFLKDWIDKGLVGVVK